MPSRPGPLLTMFSCLAFLVATPAGGQVERFIVKDRIATLRLVTLDGDRVEEQIFDAKGVPTTRTLNLDVTYLKETLPGAGPDAVMNGSRAGETPLGQVVTTYQDGVAVAHSISSRRRPAPAALKGAVEALAGKPVVRGDALAPPGGFSAHGLAYGFYDSLGLFIPWTLQEQSIFGVPVSPSGAQAGDLVFLAPAPRQVPDRVAIATGDGRVAWPDTRQGKVVVVGLKERLGGCVVSVRRIVGTPWEQFMSKPPPELLAQVSRRKETPAPRWNRIQGVASFYDHLGSEALAPDQGDREETRAVSFVAEPGTARAPVPGHVHTAAHRSLPLGSRLAVKLLETGRTVRCVVTERSYFESDRSFEVCYEAAQVLGLDERGVGIVEVEVLPPERPRPGASPGPSRAPERDLNPDPLLFLAPSRARLQMNPLQFPGDSAARSRPDHRPGPAKQAGDPWKPASALQEAAATRGGQTAGGADSAPPARE
ncbi:MAG: hypothetical protein HY815_14940 [Candidatus Riflebacteria bacterium]|nr:hypothetical protein [Candidatus Riflebacteria bacterium]